MILYGVFPEGSAYSSLFLNTFFLKEIAEAKNRQFTKEEKQTANKHEKMFNRTNAN